MARVNVLKVHPDMASGTKVGDVIEVEDAKIQAWERDGTISRAADQSKPQAATQPSGQQPTASAGQDTRAGDQGRTGQNPGSNQTAQNDLKTNPQARNLAQGLDAGQNRNTYREQQPTASNTDNTGKQPQNASRTVNPMSTENMPGSKR